MNAFALDRFAQVDSVIHRLDPRSKLAAFLLPILLISSTPRSETGPFPYYFAIMGVLIAAARVPLGYLGWRCAAGTPIILMAAAFLLFSNPLEAAKPAAVVALKAYSAIVLVTLLTSTSKFHQLLWGMRQLGSPEVLNLIVNLMYRSIFLLLEEYERMARARESRTVYPVRGGLYRVYGRHFALLFIRSWDRAERVQAAMLARGFNGSLPGRPAGKLTTADVLFAVAVCLSFAAIRFVPR